MARIRTFKPGLFRSEDVSVLPLRARWTWLGLWTQCDDHGRTKDATKLVKADVWPLDDVSLRDIEEDLAVLAAARRIVRYEDDGKKYLAVVNWHYHQTINRPGRPKHPAPPALIGVPAPGEPLHCDVCWADQQAVDKRTGNVSGSSSNTGSYPHVNPHASLTEDSHQEGKGREGKGRDARTRASPPKTCPQHPNGTTDPCGPCKDARLAADALDAEKRQRQRDSQKCRTHRGQPAHNCALCRADQLADHEDDHA